MHMIIDRLAMLTLCFSLTIFDLGSLEQVIVLLCGLTASALNGFAQKKLVSYILTALYAVCCLFWPILIYMLPLVLYDAILYCELPFAAVCTLVIFTGVGVLPIRSLVLLTVMLCIAYVLYSGRERLTSRLRQMQKLRDDNAFMYLQLEQKNREMMEKQDYEVRVATLQERNRIAREIHDNVGHLLSSSILQVGAMQAIEQNTRKKQLLGTMHDTLVEAMDNVRASVHDLHEVSVDLYAQAKAVIDGFTFCEVEFTFDMEGDIPGSVEYALLAILKEALQNVIKHSDATQVRVLMQEHPALYKLEIQDNGTGAGEVDLESGLGLKNIAYRIHALEGNLNIEYTGGFRIFVSIPNPKGGSYARFINR